jgi:phage gp46-like protein
VAAASDAAAQKLWLLQRREWEAVEALLARQAANQPLQPVELRQLRDSIASIVLALSSL